MIQATPFRQVVTSVGELRTLLGEPGELVVKKVRPSLDEHCRAFIAHSPFLLLGTANAAGECDVSPKGDAPGFVRVIDDRTLVIPDRPGNRRIDCLGNIVANPHVGIIFLIPNVQDTLRVNGRACIVRDADLLASLAARGKVPPVAIGVEVEECFLHCPKAFVRSNLWEAARAGGERPIASFARMLVDQTKIAGLTEDALQCQVDESIAMRL
jgi:PPOX class probable FMN-dependent enzyme